MVRWRGGGEQVSVPKSTTPVDVDLIKEMTFVQRLEGGERMATWVSSRSAFQAEAARKVKVLRWENACMPGEFKEQEYYCAW